MLGSVDEWPGQAFELLGSGRERQHPGEAIDQPVPADQLGA
jgi:hypothetical protein